MFSLRRKAPALPPPPVPERVPSDRVMQLSQQGYSDPEIIRTLREEGFRPTEVDKALKVALKNSAFGAPSPQQFAPTDGPAFGRPARRPSLSDELDEEGPVRSDLALPDLPWQRSPPQPPAPAPPAFDAPRAPGEPARQLARRPAPADLDDEPAPQRPPAPLARRPLPPLEEDIDDVPSLPARRALAPTAKRDSIAEVVESVIEEKWDAMQGELEALEHRIKSLEDKLQAGPLPGASADTHSLQQSLDAAHQQTAELSAKMDAMEHVVKDSLTPMMETMRSLTDALREMKQSRA